jgi:mono/diheme cytochrome c family protein
MRYRLAFLLFAPAALFVANVTADEASDVLEREYRAQTQPLVKQFCLDCHSTEAQEGEFDLEQFATWADVRRGADKWLKVAEMLDNGEMPPKDAEQPSGDQRKQLRDWVERFLHAEAAANAGDPGPVVLRRLNNAQYTYTVQDLTGVPLTPAKEFPSDSAAGEGFTNTGAAMAMSPALLTKYFDAGKELASHAVLLPDGFRFSISNSRRDCTDEILARIRQMYGRYTDARGASSIDLQGLHWESNKGGRLPVEAYLSATLAEREALAAGKKSPADVAREHGLNAKYLASLWQLLNDPQPSLLIGRIQQMWKSAQPGDVAAIEAEITRWQEALTKFQSVGHMKNWMTPVDPHANARELRVKIAPPASGNEVALFLVAGDAGDGSANDAVIWQQPRLVTPGRPDILLRDVRDLTKRLVARRDVVLSSTAAALAAADAASRSEGKIDVPTLAARHHVDVATLTAWLDYLGIGGVSNPQLDLFTEQMKETAGYEFVKGWGSAATPSLFANSSDEHVRIPGNMKPHGVTVHPSPTLSVATGWRSPMAGVVSISGSVAKAHPECGNGVEWSVQLRRGQTRQAIARGDAPSPEPTKFGPIESLAVQPGDLISLVIGPKDGNHACDLTDVELVISAHGEDRVWSLTADVSPDVLAGNPHADRVGNDNVWHFYTEPLQQNGAAIPAGSLLARWQTAATPEERKQLADALQQLLAGAPPADANSPDAALYRQLSSLGGPLFANVKATDELPPNSKQDAQQVAWGLDPATFGKHPDGGTIDKASLGVAAPSVFEIRLPADLVAGAEFVTTGVLDPRVGADGSVQLNVQTERPQSLDLRADLPIVTNEASESRSRYQRAFEDFRNWFPRALCYMQIVPVDEVVTLTLFHREDEPLRRLMLDEAQSAELDRLWTELHFVSHDALMAVDALEQLLEYASQDSDPKLFEPYREPFAKAAAEHRQSLVDAEPKQLDSLIAFAERAYRRPLAATETDELRALYQRLRTEELSHEDAFRFTLARVFVAPSFLYRLEQAPAGAAPGPVSSWELANRLSYFLWSSEPDQELRSAAASGQLQDSEVLVAQARRMLADARVRRLATEFAAQWLHIYEFDTLDEKSESHYPEFVGLRGDMYEEPLVFFTDLFQHDRSVLSVLDADHTFVNESLAAFYGIPNVAGPEWRRVDGVSQYGRGGILALASTLAKHSGASRTSPTLRGNWVSEVLLGEKLPKPPKDVPTLPEDEAAIKDLTVRQLVEKHASDARCAGCHVKVDPLGFALESYDTIGRLREKDTNQRPIDTHTRLADGTELTGAAGIRDYLLTKRRDAFLDQFCKKLLGFALGRGVQLSDKPLLTEMREQLETHDYRFSAAAEAIVRSRQFREIRGRDAEIAQSQ